MRKIARIAVLAPAFLVASQAQTSGKAEFEVASIRATTPEPGFHFGATAAFSGGPGTPDPGMFRCSKCSLATLIVKAFNLQPYQFPGKASLSDNTYEIVAKVPLGASEAEFSVMVQNLLTDRFGLIWHFQQKEMKGYHLVVARNGAKLKESTDAALPAAADSHRAGQGEAHSHSGAVVFGSSGSYRSANQTIADLVRVLSDQTGVPVDDQTGLKGKYDISLRWSGAASTHAGNHSDGAFSGNGGHAGDGGHAGGGASSAGPPDDSSGPTLFDALQQQLGLKLVPAEQALARLFVADRVARLPADN